MLLISNAATPPAELLVVYDDPPTFEALKDFVSNNVDPIVIREAVGDRKIDDCKLGRKHYPCVSFLRDGSFCDIIIVCHKRSGELCPSNRIRVGQLDFHLREQCEKELEDGLFVLRCGDLVSDIDSAFDRTRDLVHEASQHISRIFLNNKPDFQERAFPLVHDLYVKLQGANDNGTRVCLGLRQLMKDARDRDVLPDAEAQVEAVEEFFRLLGSIEEEADGLLQWE